MPDFDSLYACYERDVRTRLSRLVAPDQLDDAVQLTWIKAWRALPYLAHQGNLRAWLWSVATSVAYDLHRRRAHRADVPLSPAAEVACDPIAAASDWLDRQAVLQAVWERMNERDKVILSRVYRDVPVDAESVRKARANYNYIRRYLEARKGRVGPARHNRRPTRREVLV